MVQVHYAVPQYVPVQVATDYSAMHAELLKKRVGPKAVAAPKTQSVRRSAAAKKRTIVEPYDEDDSEWQDQAVFSDSGLSEIESEGQGSGFADSDHLSDFSASDMPNPSHFAWQIMGDEAFKPSKDDVIAAYKQLGVSDADFQLLEAAYEEGYTADPYFFGPGLTPCPRLVPERMLDFQVGFHVYAQKQEHFFDTFGHDQNVLQRCFLKRGTRAEEAGFVPAGVVEVILSMSYRICDEKKGPFCYYALARGAPINRSQPFELISVDHASTRTVTCSTSDEPVRIHVITTCNMIATIVVLLVK